MERKQMERSQGNGTSFFGKLVSSAMSTFGPTNHREKIHTLQSEVLPWFSLLQSGCRRGTP